MAVPGDVAGSAPRASAGDPSAGRPLSASPRGPAVPAAGANPGTVEVESAPAILLRPGQNVSATVLADLGGGRFRIGAFGATFVATTSVLLEPGRDYRFRVGSSEHPVRLEVLGEVRRGGIVSRSNARAGVGPGLSARLAEFARPRLTGIAGPGAEVAGAGMPALGPPSPRAGLPVDAAGLRVYLESLGLALEADAEALRESVATDGATARRSRIPGSLRAHAAELLAGPSRGATTEGARALEEPLRRAAREFLDALADLDDENVRRREVGGPTVLPLPVEPDLGLRDARLFWLLGQGAFDARDEARTKPKRGGDQEADSERGGAAGRAARDFHAVLMLDFTRLGPVRVDLRLELPPEGSSGSATLRAAFTSRRPETLLHVRDGFAALRDSLAALGLDVQGLQVQRPGGDPDAPLPASDLVAPPPRHASPASLVDLDA
jgi:hypothetical protein